MRCGLKVLFTCGITAVVLGISACGSSSNAPAAKTLSGTAAAGAAIIGTVTVKGSLGNTKSELIEADGTYNVDVTGLTAPYRLRAQGTVGGRTYKLHSYAQEADIGGNVNITPFTDLIIANAAGQIAESYFDSATPADIPQADLDTQEDALQAKLQNVLTALGVDAAINLLNTTFSADYSGLDAALDIVSIEVDPLSNVATITNLIEDTFITDSVVDPADTGTLAVNNATLLTDAVTDTQAIVGLFDTFTAAFANGTPTAASIEDLFTVGFLEYDQSRGEFLTEITTDPTLVGLGFSGVSVNITSPTTAEVDFNFNVDGVVDSEVGNWFAVKDPTLGWQLDGDRIPVDYWFNFHCNDGLGTGTGAGACGVNTMIEDNIFTNNGTAGAEFASATVSIFADGDDTSIDTAKAVIHLGTRTNATGGTAGKVEVYNGGSGFSNPDDGFSGDWKPFGAGTTTADISSAIFAANDIIKYDLYTEQLDITDTTMPAIDVNAAVPAFTFMRTLPFAPSTTPLYPDATAATITAIDNFTLDDDLTVAWTLAAGTRNSEVLVNIYDDNFNNIETWIETTGQTATTTTFFGSSLSSTAATNAGLDPNATTYNLTVRVYAEDETTGQSHSRDYTSTIPGPGTTPPPGTGVTCSYESVWDNDLEAPINPNSFADFEESLADCGTASSFTAADVAGNAYNEFDETNTFDALTTTTGTASSPGTGAYSSGTQMIEFIWYVEDASCSGCTHSYVVVESDSTIDTSLPDGFSFRETAALTDITGSSYTFHYYFEQSNFSDMIRNTASDGEIWFGTSTLQLQ